MLSLAISRSALAVAAFVLLGGGQAMAQTDLFSRDTISGVVDVRLVSADGLKSFVDGGYGRGRFGDGREGARLAEAAIVWNPRLTAGLDAVVTGEHQDGQSNGFDLGEAYLRFRSNPQAPWKLNVRAGLFWPSTSLEHDGLDWTVPDTITPSAINTWIGEEVKVAGVEASLRGVVLGQDLTFVAAGFTHNDTSGTLLSFRGWGMHDLKSTLDGQFNLSPLSAYMTGKQAPFTSNALEIDNRVGVYGGVTWRGRGGTSASVFAYDNEGDRVSVTPLVEWAWATRFVEGGGVLPLGDKLKLKGQALRGTTLMGYPGAQGIWVNVDFSSAYLSLTRDLDAGSVTGRIDAFGVTDNSTRTLDNSDEHGWAGTLAWRRTITPRTDVVVEGLYIDSTRPSRPKPKDAEATVQTALRWRF
jgi:hypothetical protein